MPQINSLLSALTQKALAKGDRKWGRMLAGSFERRAAELRAVYGHTPTGAAKTAANRASALKNRTWSCGDMNTPGCVAVVTYPGACPGCGLPLEPDQDYAVTQK
jgi:hypothetical protein